MDVRIGTEMVHSEGSEDAAINKQEADQMRAGTGSDVAEQEEGNICLTRDHAAEIIAAAEKAARDIRVAAEEEAGKIRRDAVNAVVDQLLVNQKAEELIRRYLEQDRLEYRAELEQEVKSVLLESKEEWGKFEQKHEEMCQITNGLQASWVETMSKATEDLGRLKGEFCDALQKWQRALFPSELRPLAERYTELYRVIRVDSLLVDEIVAKNPMEGAIPEENPVKEELLPSTLERLQKLNRSLNTILRKYEQALNGLDMYVYYPAEGDTFDELWHVPQSEDDLNLTGNAVIRRCIVPGVSKRVNDGGEDEVIIRAEVEI
ncbi:MAG: hypothetical protein K5697_08915 [Lachnospiraceae bacterium]|nr:hypothetical protein [Lachnospiraceae bacterium]